MLILIFLCKSDIIFILNRVEIVILDRFPYSNGSIHTFTTQGVVMLNRRKATIFVSNDPELTSDTLMRSMHYLISHWYLEKALWH
jgi:hypothetical protein